MAGRRSPRVAREAVSAGEPAVALRVSRRWEAAAEEEEAVGAAAPGPAGEGPSRTGRRTERRPRSLDRNEGKRSRKLSRTAQGPGYLSRRQDRGVGVGPPPPVGKIGWRLGFNAEPAASRAHRDTAPNRTLRRRRRFGELLRMVLLVPSTEGPSDHPEDNPADHRTDHDVDDRGHDRVQVEV